MIGYVITFDLCGFLQQCNYHSVLVLNLLLATCKHVFILIYLLVILSANLLTISLSPTDCHTYQLRAYLYQARDMYSSDKSGLSDPYAIMAFGRYSTRSRIIKESVCPTWDQTMLINQIRMFGDPRSVLESPPPVVVQFYDKDIVVSGS